MNKVRAAARAGAAWRGAPASRLPPKHAGLHATPCCLSSCSRALPRAGAPRTGQLTRRHARAGAPVAGGQRAERVRRRSQARGPPVCRAFLSEAFMGSSSRAHARATRRTPLLAAAAPRLRHGRSAPRRSRGACRPGGAPSLPLAPVYCARRVFRAPFCPSRARTRRAHPRRSASRPLPGPAPRPRRPPATPTAATPRTTPAPTAATAAAAAVRRTAPLAPSALRRTPPPPPPPRSTSPARPRSRTQAAPTARWWTSRARRRA
jgi:hypothetical protein